MIAIHKKMNFLDFMLSKNIITNDITYSFFKSLSKEPALLKNVHFSKYVLNHMKYNITINTIKHHVLCRINGKYYKSFRMLNYILKAMKRYDKMSISICIICQRAPFEKNYSEVCNNKDLIYELINNSISDSITNMSLKETFKDLIDKSLFDGNKDLFMKLTKQYNEIIL